MRVCIAGSRGLTLSPDEVWDLAIGQGFLAYCQEQGRCWSDELGALTILHGGARGIDTAAGQAAVARGLPVEVYEANWMRFGKAGGHMRNIEMAAVADAVIAIWDGSSPGTKDMISFSRSIGKPVYVIEVRR